MRWHCCGCCGRALLAMGVLLLAVPLSHTRQAAPGLGHPSSRDAAVVTADCPAERQDCTEQLQMALSSPGAQTVVVPANRAVWPTRPLAMEVGASNRRVVFEPGVTVEALKGAFHNGTDSLLSCYGLQNVSFEGTQAALRMHKADYANHHKYSHSESRMGLQLMGCRNVSVIGLNISATGGDGIYVAGWGHHVYLKNGSRVFVSTYQNSSDITVRGVHCHDNYRQVRQTVLFVLFHIQQIGDFVKTSSTQTQGKHSKKSTARVCRSYPPSACM
jgi:hypothetical protein